MLTATDITCKADSKILLHDVSVTFQPGQLHLILGPNGAGKSTLIKVLSGQLPVQHGTVSYEGVFLQHLSTVQLARMRAVLSQHTEMTFPMKVIEVVMMGRYPHFSYEPRTIDHAACREAMELFAVNHLAQRDYTTLSGGEKQRVHFARVLAQIWYPRANGLRYLLLDEPLSSLDVYYQYHFMQQLLRVLQQQDIVIVGIVHDLNLAAKFADRIVLLAEGRIVASGSKEEVLTISHIENVYRLTPHMVASRGVNYLLF